MHKIRLWELRSSIMFQASNPKTEFQEDNKEIKWKSADIYIPQQCALNQVGYSSLSLMTEPLYLNTVINTEPTELPAFCFIPLDSTQKHQTHKH